MKNIKKINEPFPAVSIDDFIPSLSLLREAAESFKNVKPENWISYGKQSDQVKRVSKNRESIPAPALSVLDYIATHFDPNKVFGLTENVFPDKSYYAGGMMVNPNMKNEGGHLAMHIDADIHGGNLSWKRVCSAILCVSEKYDSSFDLLLHDGKDKYGKLPYKFNRLNVIKCTENSWHGIPKVITGGFDRLILGVNYWSDIGKQDKEKVRHRSSYRYDLKFK
tara:strand:- start:540 stop:1205 length:666 start_codon:yes stop_codon:yes gene_type:complete